MITIVIPSFKRAGKVAGYDYFSEAKIVIPASQESAYREFYEEARLIVIPNEEDGAIAKKRNWILHNIPRPMVMIDDDVDRIVYCEGGEYFKANGRAQQCIDLPKERVMDWLAAGFNLAEQWGCPMWGINVNEDGRNYQQYKPFALTSMILGPFSAHLDHDCIYDEGMGTKEDYDMALQLINKYRKILRFNKYAYMCEHGDNAGGIVSMRTMEREMKFARAIEKKWGRAIIKYPEKPKKMSAILNGKVSVPVKGV